MLNVRRAFSISAEGNIPTSVSPYCCFQTFVPLLPNSDLLLKNIQFGTIGFALFKQIRCSYFELVVHLNEVGHRAAQTFNCLLPLNQKLLRFLRFLFGHIFAFIEYGPASTMLAGCHRAVTRWHHFIFKNQGFATTMRNIRPSKAFR